MRQLRRRPGFARGLRATRRRNGRLKGSPPPRCENCLREHGPLDACLIGVLAGVIVTRGTREVTPELLARVHVDEFWDRYCGPAVDGLEDHLGRLEADGEV